MKESTCIEKGYKEYLCKNCGKTLHTELELADHIESDWIVDAQPDCTHEGSRHKECTVCHKILATESIPIVHGTYGWQISKEPSSLPATCQADFGTRVYCCSLCGDVKYEEQIITTSQGTVYGYFDHNEEASLISQMNEMRQYYKVYDIYGNVIAYKVADMINTDRLYEIAQITAAEYAAFYSDINGPESSKTLYCMGIYNMQEVN